MSNRRAGAPRLIDWTGERCVPWAPDVQVVYEHYHRYLWARELVKGRRVLDLGSGEGFGAALLAGTALSVTGVDIDPPTVEHAKLNYADEGLDFQVASATDLAGLPDDSFDAVVAFEVIEHVADQDALLREVSRVLLSSGLFILSTPDRRAYSDATGQQNPFHERELTHDELRELIRASFSNASFLGQRVITGSKIEAIGGHHAPTYLDLRIERLGEEWREPGPPSPLYLLGVASNNALPEFPSSSTMADYGLTLMRMYEGQANQAQADADAAKSAGDAAAAEAERESAELHQLLDAERAELHQLLDGGRAEREELVGQLLARTHDLELRARESSSLAAARDDAHRELGRVEESILWRVLEVGRQRLYGAVGGRRSLPGRAIGAALRLFGRVALDWRSPLPAPLIGTAWEPVVFPELAQPQASIVIPVHSGAALTERCLHALVATVGHVPYEVILVDDDADPDSKRLLGSVSGARVIVNRENEGFLRSVNRGAGAARGRHVVLLNNDTEPQPGWLEALVGRAEAASDIGVVAAKLVFPSGELQEAGGIVWRDCTAWNYGRGLDAAAPEFNYVREVDYGSAAALLVRTELWRDLGGFDERFAPAYWEDADLCFAARSKGWRVLYEPTATVIHAEGGSMGTDVETGGKRFQEVNQPKFREKWGEILTSQPAQASHERAYAAANHRSGLVALVVDHKVPTPDRDAGSLRMRHLLDGLQKLGCHVVFLADNLAPIEPYTSDLRDTGVEVLVGNISYYERLKALGPRIELAILSRPYVAARFLHLIRTHAPHAHLAYDTVDLHFMREQRRAHLLTGTTSAVADSFRELELGVARASDTTLVVSEADRQHLLALAPEIDVRVLPLAHAERRDDAPGPDGRQGLLFVGGFEHDPNVDAAIYLAKEIMPLVWRELGDVPLSIVGAGPPPEVQSLNGLNVQVTGWVQEIDPLIDSVMVNVAPLRYGAGLKGKVTQSLAAGLPVVTSTIGAEGTGGTDGRHFFVADDPELFSRRIVELHRSQDLWTGIARGGRELAARMVSPARQLEILEGLLASSRERASSNGTGPIGP